MAINSLESIFLELLVVGYALLVMGCRLSVVG